MSGRAPDPSHINTACTGRLEPHESDLVQIGAAAEFSMRGIRTMMQTAVVYATTSEARAAWSREIAASPGECMRRTLEHIQVRPTRDSRLHLSTAMAGGVVGYRVIGRFRAQGRMIVMYFDQMLVRAGGTITRVLLTSFAHPFSKIFENSVLRDIAKRLQVGTRGAGAMVA